MRLKSIEAKSMQEALRLVKETLGDDAIIVSTREEPSGWVRITAAIEQITAMPEKHAGMPTETAAAVPRKAAAAAAHEEKLDPDEVIERITDVLLKHRVPGVISEKIISAAALDGSGDPRRALAKGLARTFQFAPAEEGLHKPLILVGPPGAGKTLMTAKLAAQSVMAGRKPLIVTTDINRAGAIEQLSAFLNILDLELHTAEDPKALQELLRRAAGTELIIDTGGLNPFDPQEMKYLAKLLASGAHLRAALVMPAGMDAEEAAEMAQTFDVLGVKNLIATRLDFARRLGGILSAAAKTGLALGTASHTPQVAHGTIELTPLKLAELLMPAPAAAQNAEKRKA
ncbi:MAG: ATP-binding protein [Alphaproteobacteria bacterium]|nr:ATP-binding protein [Alphaproteobacteria bacterium]